MEIAIDEIGRRPPAMIALCSDDEAAPAMRTDDPVFVHQPTNATAGHAEPVLTNLCVQTRTPIRVGRLRVEAKHDSGEFVIGDAAR